MQHLLVALRQLRHQPGLSAAAVLTLGLGIGASVAVFTLVNAVLLRPLPYPNPDRLMTIGFPGDRTLQLGRDVVGAYPKDLVVLSNGELRGILTGFDATPDSTIGSAAIDWSRLEHRLHFIADLFRAYQEDATLFVHPFPADQIAAIAEGRIPEGL